MSFLAMKAGTVKSCITTSFTLKLGDLKSSLIYRANPWSFVS